MNNQLKFELRGDREIVLTRHFAASPQLLWKAYTDCAHLVHWWGPHGWELTHCKLDLRPGGVWHYCMAGEYEGEVMESWGLATFEKIEAPHHLAYGETFSDKDASIIPDMPNMAITVQFEAVDGGTLMTSVTLFDSAEARQETLNMGVEAGITEAWDRLNTYLPQMRD